jgi:hypothetical protein
MISVECYLLAPTPLWERLLRRYSTGLENNCIGPLGYHNAETSLNCEEFPDQPSWGQPYFRDDLRWPKKCKECGAPFTPKDEWQVFFRRFYERQGTNELLTLIEASYGAMWRIYDAELEQDVTMIKTPLGDVNLDRLMHLLQGEVIGVAPKLTCSRPIEGTSLHGGTSFRLWVRNGTLFYGLPYSVP